MVSVPQLGSLHLFSIPDNGLSWEDCVAVNNAGCLSPETKSQDAAQAGLKLFPTFHCLSVGVSRVSNRAQQ